MTAALITTCFREAQAIGPFLDAILAQTRQPDEIVIVDAGSDDGTIEQIEARTATGAPLRLIIAPQANRSQGRNWAIEATEAELVAVTDVGCAPRADWFARIITPLEEDADVGVVAGYYVAEPQTLWGAAVAAATVPVVAEVNPDTFLPSARSVAFRREAWRQAGGYPEQLRHNEDTPFDLALKRAGARFRFCPEALVAWRPQTAPRRLFVQFWRYARGDAQSGLWFRHYAKACLVTVVSLALVIAGIVWPTAFVGLGMWAALYWARHFVRARRRTSSAAAAALAPLANAIVDAAHVAGYARGLMERGRHGSAAV